MKQLQRIALPYLLSLLCIASQSHGATPISGDMNLLPKYGEQPKSKELRELDDKFIAEMNKQFAGDRTKASDHMASLGWKHLSQGDPNVAMRRFNQAWLLNPANGTALWGIGAVLSNTNDHRAALRLFSEAEASLGTSLRFQIDHARALGFAGAALADSVVTEDALTRFATIQRQNPSSAINLQNWAMTLYLLKRYDEAWQKIELARSTPDAKQLSPVFIEELRAKARR